MWHWQLGLSNAQSHHHRIIIIVVIIRGEFMSRAALRISQMLVKIRLRPFVRYWRFVLELQDNLNRLSPSTRLRHLLDNSVLSLRNCPSQAWISLWSSFSSSCCSCIQVMRCHHRGLAFPFPSPAFEDISPPVYINSLYRKTDKKNYSVC